MKIRIALVVVFLSAGVSMADVMTLPLVLDSGWDATINDSENVDIVVDAINVVEDYVVIEIFKNFRDFDTPIVIDFESSPNAVNIIRISDENIVNLTGVDWTDYHWEIINVTGGTATFADPGDFSVAPFDTKVLTLDTLDAFGGGPVLDGSVFAPGQNSGPLDIVTDPAGVELVSFTLVQYPTPEPATLAVLALGGLVLLRRRRRRA